jgi:hypothetical protein
VMRREGEEFCGGQEKAKESVRGGGERGSI